MLYNPSVTAPPCHLPLHKGGFGTYNNFTNYAVSICKSQEIIPPDLLFAFAVSTLFLFFHCL